MANIRVTHLSKTYQVHRKEPGLKGSLKNLFHRSYELKQAVSDISFAVENKELVGFIGPNGAGKTTTLKILSGLLYPTSGSVRVLGYDPWQREYSFLRQISLVMGQKNQLWWDLPALESFRLIKDIYALSDSQYRQTLHKLVDMLDLSQQLDIQVRKLSLGERMKAELVAALLHQPKVLFLDEPTIGLDVVVQKKVRDFIKTYNREFDGSILLTSHYMADVKELCERVLIIDKGLLLFDGSLSQVTRRYSQGKLLELTFTRSVPIKELKSLPGFVKSDRLQASFRIPQEQVIAFTSRLLSSLPVSDLNIKDPDIEDVIRSVFASHHA